MSGTIILNILDINLNMKPITRVIVFQTERLYIFRILTCQ